MSFYEVPPIGKYSGCPSPLVVFDINSSSSNGECVKNQKDDDGEIDYFHEDQLDDYVDDQGYFHGHGHESNKMPNGIFNKRLQIQSKSDSIDSFKSARGDSLRQGFH